MHYSINGFFKRCGILRRAHTIRTDTYSATGIDVPFELNGHLTSVSVVLRI